MTSIVAATIAASLMLFGVGALAASTAAAQPTIQEIPYTSGEHGYPYDAVPPPSGVPGAPKLNTTTFGEAGYVEKEFKMSGTTNVYRESGLWGSNGDWGISVSQSNVPYTTRLLVRYPTNPAKFNGTVIFEWTNVTTGGDQDPVWAQIGEEAVRQGYAFVGVTAQKAGMEDLVRWDPTRYAGLGDSNDGQSYSIFTQAAEAVKADSATLLGGLTPKKLIGMGDSQSAFRVDTYVNAFQPVTDAFNGFIAVGRAVTAAPLGNGLIATSPFPADIRTNNTAPFIQLNTQGDIVELDAAAARQPDNTDLRTWELPGASHIDAHEASYEVETIAREEPTVPVPQCIFGTPIEGTGTALDGVNQTDNMALYEVENAAMMDMQKWLVDGTPAPKEPSQISTTPVFFGLYDLVNSNQYGVGNGGIRLAEAEVPTEEYSVINFSKPSQESLDPITLFEELKSAFEAAETGSISNSELRSAGLCLLSGYFYDLSSSKLKSLYPTAASYAAKYKTVTEAAESAGFITPDDAAEAIANAEAGYGAFQQPPLSIP
ncbi:MAG TPA: alpha/beta hydrolase domain-containing protein [Solirubrobacteraceae bacterium]|nr:alpha/beta hydrolase domain-containing protein [Solirubrobacteraceae bacterium]